MYYIRLLICIFLFQVILHIVPKKDREDNTDPTTMVIGIGEIIKELEKSHA